MSIARWKERVLQTFADGLLFGSRTGDGQPRVLALHGWGRTHRDFDAVLRPAQGAPLDAVSVDLPGFGATPPPVEPWGAAEYAAAVATVLGDMKTPAVVVGHSFGGRVALDLATLRPDEIGAVVLVSVPLLRLGGPRRPAAGFRLVRSLHRVGLVGSERLERARQRYGSSDYRAARGIMRDVFVRAVGETYERELDAVSCPVTLVWGDDDSTVPLAVAQAALERLRRAGRSTVDLVVLKGAGHLVPLTAPAELRGVVDRLLG
jgi:pimeloyl-ACP methyl ester carboxylesterase